MAGPWGSGGEYIRTMALSTPVVTQVQIAVSLRFPEAFPALWIFQRMIFLTI